LKSYSIGEFSKKMLSCSPKLKFGKISKVSVCSAWFAASIGVSLVKIGGTVQKLFNRGVFEEKNLPCSPKLEF
jgi:hypothetical protein